MRNHKTLFGFAMALFMLAAPAVPKQALAAADFVITSHQIEGVYNNNVSMFVEMQVTNTGPAVLEAVQIHPVGCDSCGVYVDSLAAGQTASYSGDVLAPANQYNAADPRLGLNWQVTSMNGQ